MTKSEFLQEVRDKLRGLSEADIERSLDFYREMIDDRMEDGMTEQEAVSAMGSADDVARDILMDTPLPKLVKAKTAAKQRKWRAWEIVLLVLGAPVWVSLLIAAVAVLFAVYMAIWSVVIALWATVVVLGASAIGLLIPFAVQVAGGAPAVAFVFFGTSLMLAALCLGGIPLCFILTRGMAKLSILIVRGIKSLIIGGNKS